MQTTNFDPSEYYGRIKWDLPPDPVVAQLAECASQAKALTFISTEELIQFVKAIAPAKYGAESRRSAFLLHFELSRRGVAPAWREAQKVSYRRGGSKDLSDAEASYARDCQVFDLEWIYREHPGHRTHGTAWGGLCAALFDGTELDIGKANRLAHAEFGVDVKIKCLKLPPHMQKELAVYRSGAVRRQRARILEQAHEVESDLLEAAYLNPRRGEKLRAQIGAWVRLWVCRRLHGNSPKRMVRAYRQMTGEALNPSTLRNKLLGMDRALREVGSKYGLPTGSKLRDPRPR